MDLETLPTISLGAMELRIFVALRSKAGAIASRAELIEAADCGSDKPDTVLRIMLSRIRTRFRRLNLPDPILNSYGQGYRLESFALTVPVVISPKSAARQRQLVEEFS
jgi:DNA-binding response OmpR family regulator